MTKISFEVFLKISLPLIIFLGVIKLAFYYYYFSIPIIEYLELSEIVTLFLNDIILYFLLLIPFALFYWVTKFDWLLLVAYAVVFCLGVLSGLNYSLKYKSQILLFIFCVILFSTSTLFLKLMPRKKIESIQAPLLLIFFTLVIFIVAYTSRLSAKEVYRHNTFSGTEVVFSDTLIRSNDSVYFVGKTKNFVFFYDIKGYTPIIYPFDKIVRMTLKNDKE